MRGLFPKALVMLTALALSACVAISPVKGKSNSNNIVTGGEIEVTSLDAPQEKTGSADKKPAVPPLDPKAKVVEGSPEVAPLPVEAPVIKPKPRPEEGVGPAASEPPEALDAPPAPIAAEVAPEESKSPSQLACEKKGNIWAKVADTGANYCAKVTKDSGKRCTKAGDCEGVCLARSGTCAPFEPLFGCNEILQEDGAWITQCIN